MSTDQKIQEAFLKDYGYSHTLEILEFYDFQRGYLAAMSAQTDEIADRARLHMSLSRPHPLEEKLKVAVTALEEIKVCAEPTGYELDIAIEALAQIKDTK